MEEDECNRQRFGIVCCETLSILDGVYEKMVYVILKTYANREKKCFPSVKTIAKDAGICESKTRTVLNTLERKKVIARKPQYKANGGQLTTEYTIYDSVVVSEKKKSTKTSPQKQPNATTIPDTVPEFPTGTLEETAEKERASQVDDAAKHHVSTRDTQSDIKASQTEDVAKHTFICDDEQNVPGLDANVNPTHIPASNTQPSKISRSYDNTRSNHSQDQDNVKYSMEQLKVKYDYQSIISALDPSERVKKDQVDACFNLIVNTINSDYKTFRVHKQLLSRDDMIGKILSLNKDAILWALRKLAQQANVNDNQAYLLTLLYSASDQHTLEKLTDEAKSAHLRQNSAIASGTKQFRNFTERTNNNYMEKILGQYSAAPEDVSSWKKASNVEN